MRLSDAKGVRLRVTAVFAVFVGILVAAVLLYLRSPVGSDHNSTGVPPDSNGQLFPDAASDAARFTLKTETVGAYTVRLRRGSEGSRRNHIEVLRDGRAVYSRDILMGSFTIGHVSNAPGAQLLSLGPPLTKGAIPALVIAERTNGENGPVALSLFEFGDTLRHVTTQVYDADVFDPDSIARRQKRWEEQESGGLSRPDSGA